MPDEPTRAGESDDVRRGRLLNELFDRRVRGDLAGTGDTVAVDPELKDELGQCLDLLDDLKPASSQLETLIAQGRLAKSADPQYPAELGPYKIIDFIGRGGMGIVLKAYEESLNRTIALKILRPDLAHDPALLTRFEREAKAAGGLQHPNIVTVYAIGQERGTHYIAMEYVRGTNLADFIQQPVAAGLRAGRGGTVGVPALGLPPGTIRHIFRQLLSALAAAHDAGLIHRDVKSSNILLEQRLREQEIKRSSQAGGAGPRNLDLSISRSLDLSVKLADFGLARMRSSQTQLTVGDSILGTPEYMSPEQARGDADLDHRTDLYSAGVVLYEMLTGRTPFQADTPTATLHKILYEDAQDPRKFDKSADPVLATLALRLMAKAREERLGSASDVIEILDRNERVTVMSERRRVLKRVAVAGLIVLFVSVLSYVVARPRPITAVSVDDDDPVKVLVRRGHDADWEEWCRLPEQASRAHAELVDLDGTGEQAIAVATDWALGGGTCLRLLAPSGEEIKTWDLSSTTHWPGYEPSRPFGCTFLVADDIDHEPGDELVVIVRDPDDYATHVSILNPRTFAIRSTFWHLGHVHGLAIVRRFFDSARPAIVAWGVNNQLNGFDTPEEGDEDARTAYGFVPVVLILDPEDMNGVGPPRCSRFEGLGEALPYAYAYLNAPEAPAAKYLKGDPPQYMSPEPRECLSICSVFEISTSSVTAGVTLRAEVARPLVDGGREALSGGALLDLDARLDIQNVIVQASELTWTDEDKWKEHWKLIIQDGCYIER